MNSIERNSADIHMKLSKQSDMLGRKLIYFHHVELLFVIWQEKYLLLCIGQGHAGQLDVDFVFGVISGEKNRFFLFGKNQRLRKMIDELFWPSEMTDDKLACGIDIKHISCESNIETVCEFWKRIRLIKVSNCHRQPRVWLVLNTRSHFHTSIHAEFNFLLAAILFRSIFSLFRVQKVWFIHSHLIAMRLKMENFWRRCIAFDLFHSSSTK